MKPRKDNLLPVVVVVVVAAVVAAAAVVVAVVASPLVRAVLERLCCLACQV